MLRIQDLIKKDEQTQNLTLSKRLPPFIHGPCSITTQYQAKAKENFYLLQVQTEGLLKIQCQRCLEDFSYAYKHNSLIAVCQDEQQASDLLEQYECVVSDNLQIDLDELVIDELYLFAPQIHPNTSDCSQEIEFFLGTKTQTN